MVTNWSDIPKEARNLAEVDVARIGIGMVRQHADGRFEHIPAHEVFFRHAWEQVQTTCQHGVRDPRACHKCNPGDGARSL